ncbi:MAG TPA: PAS domain-containing protein [Caulobacteraceae bacterium]|jgi:hypothetical protein
MFHLNTELLIDYWRELAGAWAMPLRAEVDPAGFAHLAPRVFIAQRTPGDVIFRLAGEEIVGLHGAPLRGVSLLARWRREHRAYLLRALDAALKSATPVVIGAGIEDAPSEARLEVLFAPLRSASGAADRFLGLYQTSPASGQLACPAGLLSILAIDGATTSPQAAGPRLASVDGRRIA